MIVLRRCFSRLVVCLASIVTLLLAGCKIDGTVEFQADGRTKIDLTFEDSDDTLTNADSTCEGLKVSFETKVRVIKNPKVENVTEPGGHLKCRVTSNEPFDGKIRFTENKDTYSFVVPDMHDSDDYSDFQTRIVVTMPGKVIKASKGKISGNKVIVNNFEFFGRGISITARKGQGASVDKSAGSSGGRAGVSSPVSGGFPAWGWVGVGTGAMVVVAVVAFIAGRKRRAASGVSGPGGPGAGSAAQQELAPQGPRPR